MASTHPTIAVLFPYLKAQRCKLEVSRSMLPGLRRAAKHNCLPPIDSHLGVGRIRWAHVGRAFTLLLLAAAATVPSLTCMKQVVQSSHASSSSTSTSTSTSSMIVSTGGQLAVGDPQQALLFERVPQQLTTYHAPLRVHLTSTAPARLASVLKAYSPHWVVWVDASDHSDVLLHHADACISTASAEDVANATLGLVGQHTQQHTVLLQQGMQGCVAAGAAGPGRALTDAALTAWQAALLVVSPSNLELQVQAIDPSLQDSMRLWSMPWGADWQALQQPSQINSTDDKLQALVAHKRLVVTWGAITDTDPRAFTALLTAAAQTQHKVAVLGRSETADGLCGWTTHPQQAEAPTSEQRRLCQSMLYTPTVVEGSTACVRLLQAARYVAVLHTQELWQLQVADAVLLQKRLILFNHTAPSAHYRWLRPFASLVEPTDQPQQLVQQLAQVLAQEPPKLKDFQYKDAMSMFQWSVLVPRLFDRIWAELRLARFPSPAQLLIEPVADPAPTAASRQLHAAMDALTPVCAERSDDVLQWDPAAKLVVQTKVDDYINSPNISCPPIIMLISWWDRSIGVCQDAAQMSAYWGHIPLLPAGILSKHVGQDAIKAVIAAGRLPKRHAGNKQLQYHEFCAGSVIFSLSVAYGELVAVMKDTTQQAGVPPFHKYWFMPNYDVMNKWEVNSTVLLTKTADRLLCKTRACHAIMRAWLEHNCPQLPSMGEHDVMFTSFSTPDPATGQQHSADFTQFLHLMGKSPYKNTQPLLEAWARNPDFPPLTISTYDKDTVALVKQFLGGQKDLGYTPLNLRLVDTRMSVRQLNGLLLGIGNHVCPSQKEGFGHYINQARASSALLLTTDYPPMREFVGDQNEYGIACPYSHLFDMEVEMFSAVNNPYLPKLAAAFNPEELATCIRRALALSVSSRKQYGSRARQRYLQEQGYFASTLQALQREAEALQKAFRRATQG